MSKSCATTIERAEKDRGADKDREEAVWVSKRSGALTGKFLLVPVLFVLGACTSAPGDIFRQFSFGNDQSITTGSRQRIVSSVNVGSESRPGLVNPTRIVCAEPSPDVAAIVANAFGFSVSVLGQGSGALSASQVKGVIQLAERTASIQLLRDQMYRACEAYANGAVSGTTYSLIMSKMNKVMVSLMLGETAGGAFGRSLAAAGGKASGKGKTSSFQGAVKNIDEAAKKLAQANKDVADAEDAWKNKQALADNEKKEPRRTELQGEADALKAKRDAAIGKRDALKELLQSSISAAAESAAEITNITASGGLTRTPDADIAGVLKDMQKQYLDDDMSDAVISACLVDLSLADAEDATINADREAAARDVVAKRKALRLAEAFRKAAPTEFSLIETANIAVSELKKAKETYNDYKGLDRYSALGSFCTRKLDAFMKRVLDKQHIRKMKEIDLEIARIKAETSCADCRISDYAKAVKACAAFKEEQKKQCIAGLAKAAETGKAPGAEQSKPKPGAQDSSVQPTPSADPSKPVKKGKKLAPPKNSWRQQNNFGNKKFG